MLVHAEKRRHRPSMWMWTTLLLLAALCFSTTQTANWCENVLEECRKNPSNWTKCYEDRILTCVPRRRGTPGFVRMNVKPSEEAEGNVTPDVRVQIPSSALQKIKGASALEEVMVVASVLNSTYFESPTETQNNTTPSVLGWRVLSVKGGTDPIKNLIEPIKLTFRSEENVTNGLCVFWKEPENLSGKGSWSTDGCQTKFNGEEFICSSSHMSFFAVLVNPEMSVGESHNTNLRYITYVGRRGRSEKAIGIHMQLTAALLFLHLSFLLSGSWFHVVEDQDDGWACRGLGLILHWSLLATLTWLALEGFHLYLLLVRVFNISVERYLLKLSIVGWGFPTLAAMACGISGVYGKYILELKDKENPESKSSICWMSSEFKHRQVIGYLTVAFLCLVVLYNTCMLTLVVFKLYLIRSGNMGLKNSNQWRNVKKEKGLDLWKKCAAVLILSCVLGLPWGLASTTYISLSGVYVFTILNSLQGLFMFLWSVSLVCKSRSHRSTAAKDLSTQKMITASTSN
ncbi:adhesion G protein-coupled receptor G3 isoform X2 [Oryzias melastigma]|uniref:adhesion G protein-coupled receptor G3 isoform X2 n=1 Tax=Oryzias melastigma TaxID=30732 RepID=UPI000CF80D2C|nr:adhesion G protein-coupled receptor G3 isoform X2 [Oryzias melastigma]